MAASSLIRTILVALCLVAAADAAATTIEAPFQLKYGIRDFPIAGLASTGLYFEDAPTGDPPPQVRLFGDQLLSPTSLGTSFFADASSDGAEFERAAEHLTDGVESWVLLGFTSQYLSAQGAVDETQLFSNDPLGTGGVDLAGFRIDRIGYRLDQLLIESPGSDPNGDGNWTDMTVRATLLVEGEAVPEPGAAALAAIGVMSLWLARWRS